MSVSTIKYELLQESDLILDATYEGGLKFVKSGTQRLWIDPLPALVGSKASGGFRKVGRGSRCDLVVLYSDLSQPEWPDHLDVEAGTWTYFGDNKKVGDDLHSKIGNRMMRDWFTWTHAHPSERHRVPPIFVFTRGRRGKDVVFRGLAVPGHPALGATEDLTAVWRYGGDRRFQNYRAIFTLLDTGTVPRDWISSLLARGDALLDAPDAYLRWVKRGEYVPLRAERIDLVRTKEEQLPSNAQDQKALEAIYRHFAPDPYEFEHLAADIVQMMDPNVTDLSVTARMRDRGRDAIGRYRIGVPGSSILVDFAVEAKCYRPGGTSVGVKEVARLISRLRHRQFGVLVTTSFVAKQAYEELIEDAHPVVVLAGTDLIQILAKEARGPREMAAFLRRRYPVVG